MGNRALGKENQYEGMGERKGGEWREVRRRRPSFRRLCSCRYDSEMLVVKLHVSMRSLSKDTCVVMYWGDDGKITG